MGTSIHGWRILALGAVPTMIVGVGLTACSDHESDAMNVRVVRSAITYSDPAIGATLKPVRALGTPGKVYTTSLDETFEATGTFTHTLHVYQPDDNGEPIAFELEVTDSSDVIDWTHSLRSVVLTTHPGEADESSLGLADAWGKRIYTMPTSQAGWYRLSFEYHAPNAWRTLSFSARDAASHPLQTYWSDPPATRADVRARIVVEQESYAFLKGGAYRNATEGEYAYVDDVRLDGSLLYQRAFDQGPFSYPLGRLSASAHTVEFSFRSSGTNPAYLWFGVNDESFDPASFRNQWDTVQFLYRGPMHTGDYDAWNEGVAFAQGDSLRWWVRPPPVRRGTTVEVALDHWTLRGPWWNGQVRIYRYGDSEQLGWVVSRARDYTGGVGTPTGVAAHNREHWMVEVPSDAPVGRYVLRAFGPWGGQLGSDVMFYVLHNPYGLVQSGGLTHAELEAYAYDEDEDGMPLEGDYGPDRDNVRDHFTTAIEFWSGTGEYQLKTRLTGAFRRTGAAHGYSLLDYAVAAADGTSSEFETMRRLYRLVAQRFFYNNPTNTGDTSALFGVASSSTDTFLPDEAALMGRPGYSASGALGVECFEYAQSLTAVARAMGVPARAISGGDVIGFGNHQFTEAFIPDLPHHGGYQTPVGGQPSDQDPWYVFDPTSPFTTGSASGISWTISSESIASRAMYGRASRETRPVVDGPAPFAMITGDVDWTPAYDQWSVNGQLSIMPPSEILETSDAYSSGPEYWLTDAGAQGYIGLADKDIYRVSQAATGASSVRVRTWGESGSELLQPALCVAPATGPSPAFEEICDNPSDTVALPPGESYVVVFNALPAEQGPDGRFPMRGDAIQYRLDLEYEGGGCDDASAEDMGTPGTAVTVANNDCLKITQYPDWWGIHRMQLQSGSSGTYPIPFSWSNCGSTGGGELSADWQSIVIDDISDACTMLIDLDGAGDGDVTLYYYGM
ncbi:MAG: transglutaminase domain-containing protein [Polyangiaceae bacterium]|nr:transglutaminase domain-containing protein [Polyangiaceae bacterium]